ncbi:AbrB/MazE/SpoVT family DNA-binding domain-containing protein [Brevibacillus borstelensis]|uniref:AbrB/MazE/SpoVT family DNA-binding domain-containing protein n=1 Tax=Brevibacillus TaxID=55080 RepID=UPI00148FA29C|nr:AbrB/MazE/SpoVT family DNA-binding domain-containing protein [Brevibacillus borstelensis]MED1854798.1 AbrB/MazE/SpoVT family DNA-binding domain-containing protein [Brevibacillus borstelensis]NOU53800.1 AbrB/MazE/SpoVT family DNA-binding domain-containing protein [Brevibacillus borstelensis]
MDQHQKIDHYYRFVPIVDNEDSCLLVVPMAILKQANLEIGDDLLVMTTKNGLAIKKKNSRTKDE